MTSSDSKPVRSLPSICFQWAWLLTAGLVLTVPPGRSQPSAPAGDTETRYLKLQEAYTQRLEDIESRFERESRELLNKFILALVRVEQNYKDEGDLEGVMASRALREELLVSAEYPDPDLEYPETLADMVERLYDHRENARDGHQAELDELNRTLLRALEPYKVEYTKMGDLDRAIEIRDLQNTLREGLGEEGAEVETASGTENRTQTVSNPNAYGFSLEPPVYRQKPTVSPRETAVPFDPRIEGRINVWEMAYGFDGGRITIPAQAFQTLRERVERNQMLTVEFGFRVDHLNQGNPVPAPIFILGTSLDDCDLAVVQIRDRLYLYLRTSTPPPNRELHRIPLGKIDGGRAEHVLVTYRTGEVQIYRDGSPTRRIRREVTGLLNTWKERPAIMGSTPAPPHIPDLPETIDWKGNIYQFYLKAGLDNDRIAASHYNRFAAALTQ